MYKNFSFSTEYKNGLRTGIISTPHGIIETPAFIFCATKASIKGLSPDQFIDSQIILSNTYHPQAKQPRLNTRKDFQRRR